MSVVLYGIKNCDSVKKARRWLETEQIDYTFHDFRVDGLDRNMLENFLNYLDWETLLNKRGTTWRKLSENQRSSIDEQKALQLMQEYPTLMKRPILANGRNFSVGFSEDKYRKTFYMK